MSVLDTNEEIVVHIMYFLDLKSLFKTYSNVSKLWSKASLLVILNPKFNLDFEDFDKEEAIRKKYQGNRELEKKNYKSAIQYYSESINFDPKVPHSFSNRSLAYFYLEEYQKSLNDASKTIHVAPKWFKGYWRKGNLLKSCGYDYKPYFEQCIKLNPELKMETLENSSNIIKKVELNLNESYNLETKEQPITSIETNRPIFDISVVSNLLYISPEKFLKKYNFKLFPSLTNHIFKLTSSMVFDDTLLVKLAKNNTEFEVLEIQGCRNITLDGILFCKENYLKKLKKVDIRECQNFKLEDIKVLEDHNIEVIYSCDFESELPSPYKKKIVKFSNDHLEFLKLLNLENEDYKNGILATKIISSFRKMTLILHPDISENKDTIKISRLNYLMDHLYGMLQSDDKIIYYRYPVENTNILAIESK